MGKKGAGFVDCHLDRPTARFISSARYWIKFVQAA
jgi:hypothetical protein